MQILKKAQNLPKGNDEELKRFVQYQGVYRSNHQSASVIASPMGHKGGASKTNYSTGSTKGIAARRIKYGAKALPSSMIAQMSLTGKLGADAVPGP